VGRCQLEKPLAVFWIQRNAVGLVAVWHEFMELVAVGWTVLCEPTGSKGVIGPSTSINSSRLTGSVFPAWMTIRARSAAEADQRDGRP
jgi:hypothetical protein